MKKWIVMLALAVMSLTGHAYAAFYDNSSQYMIASDYDGRKILFGPFIYPPGTASGRKSLRYQLCHSFGSGQWQPNGTHLVYRVL